MKAITVSPGAVALVDDFDFDKVSGKSWRVRRDESRAYAIWKTRVGGRQVEVSMHRLILGLTVRDGVTVDHVNGNGLDNRIANLRVCTTSQNAMNQKVRAGSRSGLKGVTWAAGANRWRAQIGAQGHVIHIGFFEDKVDAAHAYDFFAFFLFGEFARPNL